MIINNKTYVIILNILKKYIENNLLLLFKCLILILKNNLIQTIHELNNYSNNNNQSFNDIINNINISIKLSFINIFEKLSLKSIQKNSFEIINQSSDRASDDTDNDENYLYDYDNNSNDKKEDDVMMIIIVIQIY